MQPYDILFAAVSIEKQKFGIIFVPQTTMRLLVLKGPVSEQTLKVVLRCTPDPRKCFRSHNPLNSYAAVYRSRSILIVFTHSSHLKAAFTLKRCLFCFVLFVCLFVIACCPQHTPPKSHGCSFSDNAGLKSFDLVFLNISL